ncbi:chemotaxis protein [Acinetobacter nectaris]|uniref:chemotaxis protein n=1 Tax=Acinetobacter nectaris TaxID=1219382 RepID=UPI001F461D90|nr:chemotaxis protein [Acinetobacter nectaris]MCF9033267.1 chemotaxis protein [Acinetobacter nectaris]
MSDQISTSFNPTALLMVKSEIDNSIQQIATLISSLVEDQQVPFGLDDALAQLNQCSKVLYLINQETLGKTIQYSAEAIQQVLQTPNNIKTNEIHLISNALLSVKRYIEFSCLEEKNVPVFLLDQLNQLEHHLKHPITQEATGLEAKLLNYPQIDIQVDNIEKSAYTHQLYKICLKQLLLHKTTGINKVALIAVAQQLTTLSVGTPSELYWKFVFEAFTHIEQNFFTTSRLRTFIQIEKNIDEFVTALHAFEPTKIEFANVIRICLGQNSTVAEKLSSQLQYTVISDETLNTLQDKLRAPDYDTVTTVAQLLSDEIISVRQEIEFNYKTMDAERFKNLQKHLLDIRNTLAVLNLTSTAQTVTTHLDKLQNLEQLHNELATQELMQSLNQSLNELGLYIRKNTPNLLQRPVINKNIALDRLDNAYITLAQELKGLVESSANQLTDYQAQQDISLFETLPHALEEMAGAALFLFNSPTIYQAFTHCAHFMENALQNTALLSEANIKTVLSVCASVDISLEEINNKQPIIFEMFDVALRNSQELQHAA